MQTRTDLPPAEGSRAELHDRLNQRLEALSPPLLQMVLDFVEFLLGQQQRLEAVLDQEDELLPQSPISHSPSLEAKMAIARQGIKDYRETLSELAQ